MQGHPAKSAPRAQAQFLHHRPDLVIWKRGGKAAYIDGLSDCAVLLDSQQGACERPDEFLVLVAYHHEGHFGVQSRTVRNVVANVLADPGLRQDPKGSVALFLVLGQRIGGDNTDISLT